MADPTKILSGSFKGVPFTIEGGALTGGRKVAVKEFPGRDTQSVEDLGQRPRAYSLDIIVTDKPGQDYFAYRDALIAVIEEGGPGELIHPLYGRIDNIVAVSYSLNETFSEFGATVLSVQFELDSSTGIPVRSTNVVTELSAANDTVRETCTADISENVRVTPGFPENFAAAVANVTAAISSATKAVSYRGEVVKEKFEEYAAKLETTKSKVNEIVSNSQKLAESYETTVSGIDTLYTSARARFDAYLAMFSFDGGSSSETQVDTAKRIERKRNADVLAAAVNTYALGYAYVAAPSIEFNTTRDIDTVSRSLDAQYRLVINSAISQEAKDAITELRVKVLQALDEIRLSTSQIITIETPTTSARLLAFSYYGSDELGEVIANLNGLDDVSFVSGEVEILTL